MTFVKAPCAETLKGEDGGRSGKKIRFLQNPNKYPNLNLKDSCSIGPLPFPLRTVSSFNVHLSTNRYFDMVFDIKITYFVY